MCLSDVIGALEAACVHVLQVFFKERTQQILLISVPSTSCSLLNAPAALMEGLPFTFIISLLFAVSMTMFSLTLS